MYFLKKSNNSLIKALTNTRTRNQATALLNCCNYFAVFQKTIYKSSYF